MFTTEMSYAHIMIKVLHKLLEGCKDLSLKLLI